MLVLTANFTVWFTILSTPKNETRLPSDCVWNNAFMEDCETCKSARKSNRHFAKNVHMFTLRNSTSINQLIIQLIQDIRHCKPPNSISPPVYKPTIFTDAQAIPNISPPQKIYNKPTARTYYWTGIYGDSNSSDEWR